jgi:hypothetical protein
MDSVVLEQAHKDNRNLYIVYIDYRKAFDSVPHRWLIRVLEIHKIDTLITLDNKFQKNFVSVINMLLIYLFASMKLEKGHKKFAWL